VGQRVNLVRNAPGSRQCFVAWTAYVDPRLVRIVALNLTRLNHSIASRGGLVNVGRQEILMIWDLYYALGTGVIHARVLLYLRSIVSIHTAIRKMRRLHNF
jgi:hypothetical protein